MYRTNETHAPVPFRVLKALLAFSRFFLTVPLLVDLSDEHWTGVCDSVFSVFVFRKSAVVSLLGSVFALAGRFHVPRSYGRSFMSRL